MGDSLEADYCGARAFGFQALHLDRSDNERVTVYQDWLTAPEYPGKSSDDIRDNTVKDLSEVRSRLEQLEVPPPSPPLQEQRQAHVATGGSSRGSRAAAAAGTGEAEADGGAYHDGNEVDKTQMEGHVTQVGERSSAYPARARALSLSPSLSLPLSFTHT